MLVPITCNATLCQCLPCATCMCTVCMHPSALCALNRPPHLVQGCLGQVGCNVVGAWVGLCRLEQLLHQHLLLAAGGRREEGRQQAGAGSVAGRIQQLQVTSGMCRVLTNAGVRSAAMHTECLDRLTATVLVLYVSAHACTTAAPYSSLSPLQLSQCKVCWCVFPSHQYMVSSQSLVVIHWWLIIVATHWEATGRSTSKKGTPSTRRPKR
jgi:hypothetical protein